ncbi:MAG: GspH/FimT family pseudopilin [Gemmatimonadaceae bacterium]
MRGFTIVELVITMLIAIILVTLALPSFRELMIRNNVTETTNRLVHDLSLARSEAVRRGVQVELVNTGGGASWASGWAVKADSDPIPANVNSFPTVVINAAGAPADYSVCAKASGATTPAGDQNVIFNSTGALNHATKVDINIMRPDGDQAQSQYISVSISGVVTSGKIGTSTPVAPTSC